MASYLLKKESREILAQMGAVHYDEQFVCPVLKILQMRHKDLDIDSTVKIVKELINE